MQTSTMAGDKENTKRMQVFKQWPTIIQSSKTKRRAANRDDDKEMPATVVETTNSSQSQMSSIDIGEFGMNTSKRGNTTTFALVVREKIFPKVKFIGGKNTSLDYSTVPTSICGLMRLHCDMSHADAYQWWEEQHNMVKTIHTECWNNKIKNIKQLFTGKLISRAVK
jgi:hypothetical protein